MHKSYDIVVQTHAHANIYIFNIYIHTFMFSLISVNTKECEQYGITSKQAGAWLTSKIMHRTEALSPTVCIEWHHSL